jgi:deazaflavin-dependent oxidoreductase (nitroreductase family)
MEMKDFNQQIIEEFRANEGKVAMFADYPMVILHTIGAKSGNLLLVPLVLTYREDDMLLFATFAGSPRNPAWVYNLRANPEIDVELGTETMKARVVELSEEDAKKEAETQAGMSEVFEGYIEKAAPRRIPVFRIERL